MASPHASASEPITTPHFDQLKEAVQAGLPTAIAELSTLVRIPSVSWDGFDPAHVRASAEKVAELAREVGSFDSIEIIQVPIAADAESGAGKLGLPAVLARRAARNGRPTVLLYAHHDVQPEGDEEQWDSKPFEPTLRGDRLYGRGTADDKAGVVTHLAAIRALNSVIEGEPDVGIVLFVEGEEEFGSRALPGILEQYHDQLAADAIVVADSGNWDLETPALTVGLRGAVAFNLRITTLDHASHSGQFGGQVPDAMLAAVQLLHTLWHKDGSVAVHGLHAHEAETPEYDERKLRDETGLLEGVTTIGSGDILSRAWYQPAITVTGIDAPTVKNASNTLVPSVRVRISARVAPGQDARQFFEKLRDHLLEHAPFGAQLSIEDLDLGQPFLVDTDGWAAEDALATMQEAWGAEPVQMGSGGSIPFIADLVARYPKAQILITGVEDPDTRAHSPNESLHLPTLQRTILSEALLLARLNSRTV
ncbi:MAG TPA: dipeptidase [Pseudolysinimonas sp.]|jgi:acetylornithine deacetylase/succinyl-diaminopimelate desuccinylase-like protein